MCEITNADRPTAGGGDGEVGNLLGVLKASVHECEIEHVVFFMQAGGRYQVTRIEGRGDIGKAQPSGGEANGVDDDLEFGGAAADDVHARHSGNAQEAWLDVITCDFPERRDVTGRTGEADACDGEGCKGESPDIGGGGSRQGGADLRQAAIDVKFGLFHRRLPIEEHINLG